MERGTNLVLYSVDTYPREWEQREKNTENVIRSVSFIHGPTPESLEAASKGGQAKLSGDASCE